MELLENKTLWIWETGPADASDPALQTRRDQNETVVLKRIPALQLQDLQVCKLAVGKSCAVLTAEEDAGRLYQMGSPGVENLTLDGIASTLSEVSLLKSHIVTEVACGYHHVGILVKSGAAFCWGLSSFGQCGTVADLVSKPNLVKYAMHSHVKLRKISCGKFHTMAISHVGELWGWGVSGMIGGTTIAHRNTPCPNPQLVENLCGRRVLQVSCGKHHTVALTEKLPKTRATQRVDTTEICKFCHQEIHKWEDSELIMQDNGDQVIITDTHTCPHETLQKDILDSKSLQSPRVKSPTHVRSSSLPFFKRTRSPSLSASKSSGKEGNTAPSLQEIPLDLFSTNHKFSSEENLSKKNEQLGLGTANLADQYREDSCYAANEETDGSATVVNECKMEDSSGVLQAWPTKQVTCDVTKPENFIQRQFHITKSSSMPVDLWKQGKAEKSVFSVGDDLNFHDPVFPSTPESSSASLASLDDGKCRMTLPVQSQDAIKLDPESALNYLKQLSPVTSENEFGEARTDTHGTDELTKEQPAQARGGRKSISERITRSITDNQLLSPLTSYSKNVFTGVMDHIEWIKASTYDKGVAPIRDLWTKDKAASHEAEVKEHKSETTDDLHFTNDHAYDPDPLLDHSYKTHDRPTDVATPELLTLHTEVWVWGENKVGVLGLSDNLDRYQPSLLKSLNHRGIIKVVCGAHHTAALSSNAEVYTWGSNSHGQLGLEKSFVCHPEKVECKHRIWDIAAGRCHTLFLSDGVGQQPDVLVCGTGITEPAPTDPLQSQGQKKSLKEWKLRPVHFSQKMGFQSSVISGFSTLSSCLTKDNCSGFTLAFYDFAKAEREFYQHVTLVKTDLLRPFKFSDLCRLLENTPYGDMFSQTIELFGTLCYNIGLNSVRLIQAVVASEAPSPAVLFHIGNDLMEAYSRYYESLNNMVACGFFEKCEAYSTKRSNFLSDPKIINVFKKLLGDKRFSKVQSENFLQTLQFPAFRLREYANTLSKLATSLNYDGSLCSNLQSLSSRWDVLWTKLNNQLHLANQTRGFWKNEFKSTSGAKLAELLKKEGRYLVLHSKKVPLDIAHSGRFSYNWFILFTDCLAVVHYGTHFLHPLELLWCSPVTEGKDKGRFMKLAMPEDEILAAAGTDEAKSIWLNALYRSINSVIRKNQDTETVSDLHRSPSLSRHASYTFTKDPNLKGAKYSGAWLDRKPHGMGVMTWEDGRRYSGTYRNGVEDGFGEWMAAPSDKKRLKYRGWWKDGKMEGYGKLWYSAYQLYDGHFVAGLREGYGVLRTGSVMEGSVYVGGWHKDHRSGFGVEDNISKGEKYLGMWSDGQRSGVGILVNLDGLYCQTRFQNGEVGGDALLVEGQYAFEGQISSGMVLNGKGRLTMPSGDKLEGSFAGPWGDNIRVVGNLIRGEIGRTSSVPESPKTPLYMVAANHPTKDHVYTILRRYNRHIMRKLDNSKGGRTFPLSLHPDSKWKNLFNKCHSAISCPNEDSEESVDVKKIWEAVPVAIANARQKREMFKAAKPSPTKIDEAKLSWLERIPSIIKLVDEGREDESYHPVSQADITCIREYLNQSFETTLHPLGELAEALGTVFRDSYSGAGAHKWLLTHAVADVRSFVRRSYDIVRCMFPQLAKEPDDSHAKPPSLSDDTSTHLTAGDLMLPVLLPRLYPTLFTLYALKNECEDRSYWERVTRLNRHPDVALLSFLGVKPKFWLLDEKEIPPLDTTDDDHQLYGNEEHAESSKWRQLLVARAKDCTFLSAVETLQLISTTFIPAEKLNVIHSTFKVINSNVTKYLLSSHTWSMDDLFPVFQYVVIRARISHLGCEIQLIEDFLEPDMCKGEKGIMFTTLKACYFQIRVEKDL